MWLHLRFCGTPLFLSWLANTWTFFWGTLRGPYFQGLKYQWSLLHRMSWTYHRTSQGHLHKCWWISQCTWVSFWFSAIYYSILFPNPVQRISTSLMLDCTVSFARFFTFCGAWFALFSFATYHEGSYEFYLICYQASIRVFQTFPFTKLINY